MVDNTWVIDLPTQIYTLVKTKSQAKFNKSPKASVLKDTFWTLDGVINAKPVFPTIYLAFDCVEVGNDLHNKDINAVICTVQVDISVSKEQGLTTARYVSGIVMNEFKQLGFNISEAPNLNDSTIDIKRMVFRASRVIGQADIIFS